MASNNEKTGANSWPPEYESSMPLHREGDYVVFHRVDEDTEDRRRYHYDGKFKVSDYRRALDDLQETGSCSLEGEGGTLTLTKRTKLVQLTFSGRSSSYSGVSSSLWSHHQLEHLVRIGD